MSWFRGCTRAPHATRHAATLFVIWTHETVLFASRIVMWNSWIVRGRSDPNKKGNSIKGNDSVTSNGNDGNGSNRNLRQKASTSKLTYSTEIREEMVQMAVSFLSHPDGTSWCCHSYPQSGCLLPFCLVVSTPLRVRTYNVSATFF